MLLCLVSLVLLVLELFEIFTAWAEANHRDMPSLKNERRYNRFPHK